MKIFRLTSALPFLGRGIFNKIRTLIQHVSPTIRNPTIRNGIGQTGISQTGINETRMKHENIWRMIFKNYKWLEEMTILGFNPLLVGADLEQFDKLENFDQLRYQEADIVELKFNPDSAEHQIYLVLLCGANWPTQKGELSSKISVHSLGTSFRANYESLPKKKLQSDDGTWEEIYWRYGNTVIRLHVGDFYRNPNLWKLAVSGPDKLVNKDTLQASYLYWKDDCFRIRRTTKIVGEASKALNKQVISEICSITFENPQESSGSNSKGEWSKTFMRNIQLYTGGWEEKFKEIIDTKGQLVGWKRNI